MGACLADAGLNGLASVLSSFVPFAGLAYGAVDVATGGMNPAQKMSGYGAFFGNSTPDASIGASFLNNLAGDTGALGSESKTIGYRAWSVGVKGGLSWNSPIVRGMRTLSNSTFAVGAVLSIKSTSGKANKCHEECNSKYPVTAE